MKENDKFVVVAVVGISGQIDSWTTNTHTHTCMTNGRNIWMDDAQKKINPKVAIIIISK